VTPPTQSTSGRRRSPQEIIADLEAQIARIQARAERKKVKKNPTLRHVATALRSIDKALDACEDGATSKALDEARATLSAVLSLSGAGPKATRGAAAPGPRRRGQVQADAVLRFVAGHPGSRCEDIAGSIGADTKALSLVLKELKTDGRVRTEGQARGTRYYAQNK